MFSFVETFYYGGKIRSKWMWSRLHFWYSLVQMLLITLANHPIFATPLRRAFTFIWNMWATKYGRSEAVWLGSSSVIISCQFGLQMNLRKTSRIPLLFTIAKSVDLVFVYWSHMYPCSQVVLSEHHLVILHAVNRKKSSRCLIVFLKQFYIMTNGAYNAHGFLTVCWETIFYVPNTYATKGLIGAFDWNQKNLVVFFNLFLKKNWRNASVVAPWKCILTK